ncbi:hypothetical protein [Hansschlegelia zhihuaiae]|uniref:Uncharacterized protein n=1 Tax=Hansschlegelia zhihuaiae TaxID=405005 RepID=A0A4Q0MN11_9HYPH|nr:hypothetical protein [Hansschlegelia zhihuaiae]RXF74459.1 hypothetical protein EK403_06535 [Hansschlegelia zhihuaiae]
MHRIFVTGAACAAIVIGCLAQSGVRAAEMSAQTAAVSLEELYKSSIYDAAVKRRSFRRPLTPIDASLPKVTVVTLTTKSDDPVEPTRFNVTKGVLKLDRKDGVSGVLLQPTWVSLPAESRPACKGARNPVLRLQQILGMPPVGGQWELVQFKVAPKHIFRPCGSGPDITTTECAFKLPTKFSSPEERRAVEKTQLFVFEQMWSSFIEGFPEPGYPFTGMGWTYDWSETSEDHFGISEYVVDEKAPVTDIRVLTPEQFCRSR